MGPRPGAGNSGHCRKFPQGIIPPTLTFSSEGMWMMRESPHSKIIHSELLSTETTLPGPTAEEQDWNLNFACRRCSSSYKNTPFKLSLVNKAFWKGGMITRKEKWARPQLAITLNFPTFTNPTGHLHLQVWEACAFWTPGKVVIYWGPPSNRLFQMFKFILHWNIPFPLLQSVFSLLASWSMFQESRWNYFLGNYSF